MKTDTRLLIAMAVTWIVAGVVEPHLPDAGQPFNATATIQTFVLAILLFAWCKAHAASHGITPPTAAPLLVGVIAPLGIPYYFFRGFGWRRGLLYSIVAIGCFFGFVALSSLSFVVSARFGS